MATARERALSWLAEHRNPDGSWGYLPNQPGAGEPTVLAAALLTVGTEAATLEWLRTAALGWSDLLVPAALSGVGGAEAVRNASFERLLASHGEQAQAAGTYDGSLVGWSWYPGTFSWVEPTSYALVSLGRMGQSAHARAEEGRALLLDRQCDDGGWNYGNPAVLGSRLDSDPPPTAWAALALPSGPAVDRAIAYLDAAVERPSATVLSLTILAKVAHGRDAQALRAPLESRVRADGSFGGRVDWTAFAALAIGALDDGTHAFSTRSA